MRPTSLSTAVFGRVLLAAIPFAALTVAIPLVNHIEPRIFGMPFLLGWILAWILAAPGFLWLAGKLEPRP